MYFCDTLYEGVGKTPILGQNGVTSFMNAPKVLGILYMLDILRDVEFIEMFFLKT